MNNTDYDYEIDYLKQLLKKYYIGFDFSELMVHKKSSYYEDIYFFFYCGELCFEYNDKTKSLYCNPDIFDYIFKIMSLESLKKELSLFPFEYVYFPIPRTSKEIEQIHISFQQTERNRKKTPSISIFEYD